MYVYTVFFLKVLYVTGIWLGYNEGYSVWYNGDVTQDMMTLGDINGNTLWLFNIAMENHHF